MVKLQKRLLENIIDDLILKEESCGILTGACIDTYDIVLELKKSVDKRSLEKDILYDNEVKVEGGIYTIKQYKSGIIVFGFKEYKTKAWWSSNPMSVYKNTGVATIGMKILGSSIGYYSMLISDLIAILPLDYVVIRDKTDCTYARVIKRQDLERAEQAGYIKISPKYEDTIDIDRVGYIRGIYSNNTGIIKNDFDLQVFRSKLAKEQDFPNILEYLLYCKSNNIAIECEDDRPVFAGVVSNNKFYSLSKIRRDNLYLRYKGSIYTYDELLNLMRKNELQGINIVEQDKGEMKIYNRRSYMYMICRKGFDNIKVRVPLVVKDYAVKVKEEFR